MLRIRNRIINPNNITHVEYDSPKVSTLGIPNTPTSTAPCLVIHFVGGGELNVPKEYATIVWEELVSSYCKQSHP